jgi:outer membrane immunogenic protein
MKRSLLLSGTAAIALMFAGVSANAADIVEPEPEAMLFDWSGLYIGAHAGGGALGIDGLWDNSTSDSAVNLGALGGEIGGVFGGQVGFNWQAGNIVFGIEGDISFIGGLDNDAFPATTADETTGIGLDNDFLASVRARLGWADNNVMFYVTGGVAWYEGELSVKEDWEGCKQEFDWMTDPACDLDISETGGVVGAGIEWAPWQNVSIRAEGLYYFFDDRTKLCDWDDCNPDNWKLVEADTGDFFELDDALVARVGINFLFNPFN